MTPGAKSSEFMGLALYVILVILDGTVYVNVSQENMLAVGALLGAYITGRSSVKYAQSKVDLPGLAKKVKEDLKL